MAMCMFMNCNNVQLPFSTLSFFGLPNDERRSVWIEASGNDELKSIPANKKFKRVVCERHFDERFFRKQFNRTILRRNAVPNPSFVEQQQFTVNAEGKESQLIQVSKLFMVFHFNTFSN